MRQNSGNNENGVNRILRQLREEKKKGILAVCLIALMIFMWAKAFSSAGPNAANANQIIPEMDDGKSEVKMKIDFIELPYVSGRNDVITRDFFVLGGDVLNGTEEVDILEDDDRFIKKIADELKLEAIGLGEKPEVYINGKLLSLGDTLMIKSGKNEYECKVMGIEKNTVLIVCEKLEIVLKLVNDIEVE